MCFCKIIIRCVYYLFLRIVSSVLYFQIFKFWFFFQENSCNKRDVDLNQLFHSLLLLQQMIDFFLFSLFSRQEKNLFFYFNFFYFKDDDFFYFNFSADMKFKIFLLNAEIEMNCFFVYFLQNSELFLNSNSNDSIGCLYFTAVNQKIKEILM